MRFSRTKNKVKVRRIAKVVVTSILKAAWTKKLIIAVGIRNVGIPEFGMEDVLKLSSQQVFPSAHCPCSMFPVPMCSAVFESR